MEEVMDKFNPFAWAKTPEAKRFKPEPGQISIVAFGGGTDSTAVLIGLRNHGIRPDRILFADTGGERQETYDFVYLMNTWARKNLGVDIEIVKKASRSGVFESLEAWCLRNKNLPSLAYGGKSCSLKFKVEPQDKLIRNWPEAKATWKAGKRIAKFIGYEAGEVRRVRRPESADGRYLYLYPLIAWNWHRFKCLEVIKAEGLPLPGKSACFFCPANKKSEIMALPKDLKDRAVAMEQRAKHRFKEIKGLGRYFSWKDFLNGTCKVDKQMDLIPGAPCDCYDGD